MKPATEIASTLSTAALCHPSTPLATAFFVASAALIAAGVARTVGATFLLLGLAAAGEIRRRYFGEI